MRGMWMLHKRTLLRRLFISHLLLVIPVILFMGWYFSVSISDFYRDEIHQMLGNKARLFSMMIQPLLKKGEEEKIDRACETGGAQAQIRFTVILPDGRVVGDTERNPNEMDNHSSRPEIKTALNQHNEGASTRFSRTLETDMMYVAVPLQDDDGHMLAVVRASRSVSGINTTLRNIYNNITFVALLVLLFTAIVAYVVSTRINRPIDELKAGADRFAKGELSHRLKMSDVEEINLLGGAMNQMAAQLDERIHVITEQRNELQAVLASMAEAVIVVDNEGRITRMNKAAGKMLGINHKTVLNRSFPDAGVSQPLCDFLQEIFRTDWLLEREIVQGDEEPPLFLQAHGTIIRNEGAASQMPSRLGALIVMNDITKLKRLENIRRDFVSNVSHELKTPITAIKGFVETLKDGALQDPENAEGFLEIIGKHADRLNTIIEDLLNLSRIESDGDQREVERTDYSVRELTENAHMLCQAAATQKGIQIVVDCPRDLTTSLNARMIELALVNLMANAIKYTPERGLVALRAQEDEHTVSLSVSDTGLGIPKDSLPRLFERFYRVDKARSRDMGGTGLGLAIVKHIVMAHAGRVHVESKMGQGSVFTIVLPKG